MTRSNLLTAVSAVAILAASTVLADDIYRYTDENGTVHYVDRPTGAATEQRITVATSRPTQNAQADDSRPDWRERRANRQTAKEEADSAKADEDERERLCNDYRQRLSTYDNGRRLFRMDEQGERVYLTPEEIEEARQVVRERIEENCSA
ncbi:MAG: DUF4124 domain-containing protein [Pseudomonadota bacterium]